MQIIIDRNIYDDTCISKAVYQLSSQFIVKRTHLEKNLETIVIESKGLQTFIEDDFWRLLNDYKLREVIQEETKDIKSILYAKALLKIEELTDEE